MTIRINGVDVEYEEAGTGVPVVFSHGGGCDLRFWEPQRDAVSTGHRFVAYSHRFHGRGHWPADGDASADAHTEDLVAIIRRLETCPVHVVGFSSAIALRVAAREPGLVRSLTIIEPNVPWVLQGDPTGEAMLAWWRAENARVEAEAVGDREVRARLWFELVNNAGPGAFDAQAKAFRRMWLDNLGVPRPSANPAAPIACEDLAAIRSPTLALGGSHGMPYSRAILERVAACIADCELVVIPEATHFVSYQAPERFNVVLLDFLARH